MDRMGYDRENAEIMIRGRCDGIEYSFIYDDRIENVISWYQKDTSQSGYTLSGGGGIANENIFGQLSNESKRYELSIQKGEYQIRKKDRVQ
jgi:hypothetical protein